MNDPAHKEPAAELAQRLGEVVARRFGAGYRVRGFGKMAGGHAGFTFGFELVQESSGHVEPLVLKMGPAGVRRVGVADVFRQAPLLKALREHGIPVPGIRWAAPTDEELGAPYIVMERVPGRERFPLRAAQDEAVAPSDAALWSATIDTLIQLHAFPWPALGDWQAPVSVLDELHRWEPTLRKAPQPQWISAGLQARDRLLEHLPQDIAPGLVHGDFQPSNLLFSSARVTAIIDWDLATVGPSLLDIGWLMMFADPSYWGPSWATTCPIAVEEIARRFCMARSVAAADVAWFQAFAGYRFGSIACLNVHLHRSGRRPDPVWERFATDIPRLFARAEELCGNLP